MNIKCVVPISGGKDSQTCLKLAIERFGKVKQKAKFVELTPIPSLPPNPLIDDDFTF